MSRNDQILASTLIGLALAVSLFVVTSSLDKMEMVEATALHAWIEVGAVAITAFATVVLAWATFVLARHTKRLADVEERPNILVTIEPNVQSLMYLDVVVENTGTATAYNIEVQFDPPLVVENTPRERLPLQSISVLKSKQSISTLLSSWSDLQTKSFTAHTSWRRSPNTKAREHLSYSVDLNSLEGMWRLGGDPQVELADATKKIADAVGYFSSGFHKLSVNTYTSADRAKERTEWEKRTHDKAKLAGAIQTPPPTQTAEDTSPPKPTANDENTQ